MSQDTTTPPPNAAASPEKKALLAAFDTVLRTAAEEREIERLAAEARRRSRGASRLLLVVCTVILTFTSVYLYVERPEWVFPAAPAPESPAVRQASLRISVANAAQHIERYRQQRGQRFGDQLPAHRCRVSARGPGRRCPGLVYVGGIVDAVHRQQFRSHRPEKPMIRRRRGFTIIELMTVMIVIGLLAGIAVLKYIDLRHRARAVQVAADLETVRLAAYSAWYEHNTWPAEAASGQVPTDLVPYLPGNLSFTNSDYTLDWENFAPPGGGPSVGMQIGLVITGSTPRMQKALEQILGNKMAFISAGGTLTFIIVGPDGKS
jgi:prepilin-type N-terminal cleavage/methylation domain-containing protein